MFPSLIQILNKKYNSLIYIYGCQFSFSFNNILGMSRRGNSQRHGNRQGQIQRFQRFDPFSQVQQMMMSFGGLHNDPFLNGMMGFGHDPFEDMFKFSDIHKNVHNRGTQGSYVFQSFVSSSKIGPDGKVVRQDYFQNNMGEHRGGNTISQKQQAYKNNQGVNRIAQQRMLNDRGRKIVRQKRGNDIQETNHYYNIDQEEAQQFDNDWRQTDNNLKFLENHQRYINKIQQPRQMQIGYDPQVRNVHPQSIRPPQNQSRITQQRFQPSIQNSRIPQQNSRITQQIPSQISYLPAQSTQSGSRASKRSQVSHQPSVKSQQTRKY